MNLMFRRNPLIWRFLAGWMQLMTILDAKQERHRDNKFGQATVFRFFRFVEFAIDLFFEFFKIVGHLVGIVIGFEFIMIFIRQIGSGLIRYSQIFMLGQSFSRIIFVEMQ